PGGLETSRSRHGRSRERVGSGGGWAGGAGLLASPPSVAESALPPLATSSTTAAVGRSVRTVGGCWRWTTVPFGRAWVKGSARTMLPGLGGALPGEGLGSALMMAYSALTAPIRSTSPGFSPARLSTVSTVAPAITGAVVFFGVTAPSSARLIPSTTVPAGYAPGAPVASASIPSLPTRRAWRVALLPRLKTTRVLLVSKLVRGSVRKTTRSPACAASESVLLLISSAPPGAGFNFKTGVFVGCGSIRGSY